ncbi:MAG: hypothetical protein JXN61_05020 [Sedimentisphaerales bacterium]|nr:hypothetical protein [Sedimentisphaerales bacterium]
METSHIKTKVLNEMENVASHDVIINARYLNDEQLIQSEQLQVLEEIFNANVRSEEMTQMSRHFAPILKGNHPTHLALWGKTGTGKTLTMRFFMGILAEMCQTKQIPLRLALIIGLLAFLSHTRGHSMRFPHIRSEVPEVRHDMSDLYRERHLSNRLGRRMKKIRKQSGTLNKRPEDTGNVIQQLRRMLPAEGYLTEKMAQLRAKAHKIRSGHIARLEETRDVFAKLPTPAKKEAAAQLAARYNQMVGIDTRLERLDRAVAENERRIHELTRNAQEYAARYDHQKLYETIKAAEKLQHHNSRLFKIINRTEAKLSAVAKRTANEVKQIEK